MIVTAAKVIGIPEERLSSSIRAGNIDRLYFLFGSEPFLSKMYTDRIIKKTVSDADKDMDLISINGTPDPEILSEYVDSLPFFSEKKVIVIKDLNADAKETPTDTIKYIAEIMSGVPESTVLIFYYFDVVFDPKSAKGKKLIDAALKYGTVCELLNMSVPKIAELAVKKAAKGGVILSQENAVYLVERTGGKMTVAGDETAKLMTYVGKGGVIERSHIDLLVAKTPTAAVFDLSEAINSGKTADSYRIIDELFEMQTAPESILGALSGTYLDFYRAKLAKNSGLSPDTAMTVLGYPKNRSWAFTKKIYPAVSKLELPYLRKALDIIFDADIKLKSTAADKRTVLEIMTAKLTELRKNA